MSSECKENSLLFPYWHWENAFRSWHFLEICTLTVRHYLSKLGIVVPIQIPPSTKIEAVLEVSEAHSIGESEIEFIGLELLLRNTKYAQLG